MMIMMITKMMNIVIMIMIMIMMVMMIRSAEYDQTQAGVTRVKQWGLMGARLTEDDVMISASVDEVLDR